MPSSYDTSNSDTLNSAASNSAASNSVASNSVASNSVASNSVASNSVASNRVASSGVASSGVASSGVASSGAVSGAAVSSYVIITPARNEEAYIELTLKSMVSQVLRPKRWVIVSDGSTDRTDSIVQSYADRYPWIELVRMPERRERNFAGKVTCFNAGYDRVKGLEHEIVGSLDADISFTPEYFAFLISKFGADQRLGIAGTPFSERGVTYNYRFSSTDHVSGACQLFRRQCFKEIGGYVPIKGGGIDVVAVLTARSKGWNTRTFTEMTCEHHRPMGSANHKGKLLTSFKLGQRAYCLGWHPVWQIFRSIYQMSRKPYVTAGCALLAGFFWAMVSRKERPLAPELIAFQRRDQLKRLREFFFARRKEV